jgi:acetyltransferase-like isoleucine patch superfamily enzyme
LSWRGARLGRKVTIGRACRFERPWCLRLGDRVTIEDHVWIKVVSDEAMVDIGHHVFVGRGSQLDVMQQVTIGDHSVMAPHCFVVDHEHGIRADRRIDEQPCEPAAVAIGRDVWLGARVSVLAGARIGDGVVVGAHAVVKGILASGAIAVGIPARAIRFRGHGDR